MGMQPDWSSLPDNTIEYISSRIATNFDYACFRSVCNSWRSASPQRQKLPWVIVKHYITEESDKFTFELRDFPTGEFLRPQLLDKGRIQEKVIRGSSRGWIIFLHFTSAISLHNPITGVDILLPMRVNLPETLHNFLPKLERYWINKVILSSDPSDVDCVVMAICFDSRRLMFCRPRDDSWNLVSVRSDLSYFEDIISYKGLFYVVFGYKVFVCDTGPDAEVKEILPADPLFPDDPTRLENVDRVNKTHIVVSSEDLLMVTFRTIDDDYGAYICEVFRVDLDLGRMRLLKLENLGGGALFLDKFSMSVHAGNSPWCRGNCIYHTSLESPSLYDDSDDFEHDHLYTVIKAFNMDDGSLSLTRLGVLDGGFHWLTPRIL